MIALNQCDQLQEMQMDIYSAVIIRQIYITKISGCYAPFILAPAEGCFPGPSAKNLNLQYNDQIIYDHMCIHPCVSRTSCHHQWLGGLSGFMTGDMKDMRHPWHFKCSSYIIPDVSAKFQLSSMIRSVSKISSSSSVTCRFWGFLTGVILDISNVLHIWFLTCVQDFSFQALIKMCQEPPCHHHWLGWF